MRVRFSGKAKQSLAMVLLLVACGGVSSRDGSRHGEAGGSGAASSNGSAGSAPLPSTGAGGYGNTAGFYGEGAASGIGGSGAIGGASNLGGAGNSGSGGLLNSSCAFNCFAEHRPVYENCVYDTACSSCMQTYTESCLENDPFRTFNDYICEHCSSMTDGCPLCISGPTGGGGEGGHGDEPVSAGFGGGQ